MLATFPNDKTIMAKPFKNEDEKMQDRNVGMGLYQKYFHLDHNKPQRGQAATEKNLQRIEKPNG